MLLRQLQRPSSRSVAAPAAWRPILTALLRGSSRRPQSSSSTPPPTPSEPQSEQDEVQPTNKPPTLFEKLFPDEAKQARTQHEARTSKNPWSSPLLDQTPPATSDENHSSGTPHANGCSDSKPDNSPTSPPAATPPESTSSDTVALRAQSMLILTAASKQLSESDFLRLGPQGEHVEGWVGGISRVIQARDPDTLQALGHYFVLFDSAEAAAAYRGEVARLWELGKAHVPGAARHNSRSTRGVAALPLPLGLLRDRRGRDVAAAIRGFTLVPPTLRYHLELSAAHNRDAIEDLDVGGASFVDRLADAAGSRHLALVTVNGGRMSVDALRRAIEEDGRDRNLPWRVTDLENGILPFGKSILKRHDADAAGFERGLLEQAYRATGNRYDDAGEGGEVGEVDEMYRQYPRFIVPFVDNAEAQRFVRGWHRRQFTLRMNIERDDGSEVAWEEVRMLNVSVLW
ncbi:hypothetical protein F4804DRAFT_161550 [Jackrogersella minutella]|nr:hypothetical protein F4804DRAFT_161550 [Jackrogersella minutella]